MYLGGGWGGDSRQSGETEDDGEALSTEESAPQLAQKSLFFMTNT